MRAYSPNLTKWITPLAKQLEAKFKKPAVKIYRNKVTCFSHFDDNFRFFNFQSDGTRNDWTASISRPVFLRDVLCRWIRFPKINSSFFRPVVQDTKLLFSPEIHEPKLLGNPLSFYILRRVAEIVCLQKRTLLIHVLRTCVPKSQNKTISSDFTKER